MTRYTITPEDDQYRVTWYSVVKGLPNICQPRGLFKTIEDARKSLASCKPARERKYREAIEEYC